MNYSNFLMLAVASILSVSSVRAEAEKPIVAKVNKAREGLAWSSYNAALAVAESIKAGAECETDAYHTEGLEYLSAAVRVKPAYRKKAAASKLFNEVYSGNLAFKILIADWSSYSLDSASLFALMSQGVTLYAPPQGHLGTIEELVFAADGVVTRRNLSLEDQATWSEKKGSFRLVGPVTIEESIDGVVGLPADDFITLKITFEDGSEEAYKMQFAPAEVRLVEKETPSDLAPSTYSSQDGSICGK